MPEKNKIKSGKSQLPTRKQNPFSVFVDDNRGMVGYGMTYGENSYNGRPLTQVDISPSIKVEGILNKDAEKCFAKADLKKGKFFKVTNELTGNKAIVHKCGNDVTIAYKEPHAKHTDTQGFFKSGKAKDVQFIKGMIVAESGSISAKKVKEYCTWHSQAPSDNYKIDMDDLGVVTKVRPRFSK